MSDNVIQVENVTKTFRLRAGGTPTLKSAVLEMLGRRSGIRRFDALKDVTFQVQRGETLGIIGANGAGKSTLLSLICGTTAPSTGHVTAQGHISSLLELGAGFHPDLTGRENTFLYGAVMGIPRQTIAARLDSIVEFAGIREFIDQPVKHYSSGMYVRLGFAVAVEVDPDILLIDEVLAVGDADFQRKCLAKMDEFRRKRKTMLIISHDLKTIQSISDRILLLDEGRILGIGTPENIVADYQSITARKAYASLSREWGTGEVKLTGVKFLNEKGQATNRFQWGGMLEARISYEAGRRIDNPVFGFAVATESGALVYGNSTQIENFGIGHIEGSGSIGLRIDSLAMGKGTYLFSFSVHSADHKVNYHRLDNAFPILVDSDKEFEGCCYMPCQWKT
jgi:ABC-type polysaccharide/polyol phosphate transport system ATPase subunit